MFGGGGEKGSGLVHKGSSFLLVWYVEFANLPLEKGGMLSFTPLLVRRSLMLSPLSAIKWSPFSRRSMRPLSWTIFQSLVLPDHSFEMKVKAPQGAIPTNNLSVLWCLQSLHVAFCAHGDVSLSMKNSVASMITLVSGYFLKDFGNCRLTSSRVGQQSRVPSKIFTSKHTHVVTILQTEASETPNISPSCRFRTPKRSLQSTKRYSSFSDRRLCLPGFFLDTSF